MDINLFALWMHRLWWSGYCSFLRVSGALRICYLPEIFQNLPKHDTAEGNIPLSLDLCDLWLVHTYPHRGFGTSGVELFELTRYAECPTRPRMWNPLPGPHPVCIYFKQRQQNAHMGESNSHPNGQRYLSFDPKATPAVLGQRYDSSQKRPDETAWPEKVPQPPARLPIIPSQNQWNKQRLVELTSVTALGSSGDKMRRLRMGTRNVSICFCLFKSGSRSGEWTEGRIIAELFVQRMINAFMSRFFRKNY